MDLANRQLAESKLSGWRVQVIDFETRSLSIFLCDFVIDKITARSPALLTPTVNVELKCL